MRLPPLPVIWALEKGGRLWHVTVKTLPANAEMACGKTLPCSFFALNPAKETRDAQLCPKCEAAQKR